MYIPVNRRASFRCHEFGFVTKLHVNNMSPFGINRNDYGADRSFSNGAAQIQIQMNEMDGC